MKVFKRLSKIRQPDEQTQAAEQWLRKKPIDRFSRLVATPEALQEPFRAVLLGALHAEERLGWMIEVPPQGIFHPQRARRWLPKLWQVWEITPAMLVALTSQRLLLIRVASLDKNPELTAIPLEDIFYLEHGMILLFSWMVVHWRKKNLLRQDTIYFNSVDANIFSPLIHALRRSTASGQAATLFQRADLPADANAWADEKQPADRSDRALLKGLPLKFFNMVPTYGLLKDERVCQVIYRPKQWRRFLGLTRVMSDPSMAMVQTDAYLILAEEDLSETDSSYGLSLTFLPRKFLRSASTHINGKHCFLNLHLEEQNAVGNWSVRYPLEMEAALGDFARYLQGELDIQPG